MTNSWRVYARDFERRGGVIVIASRQCGKVDAPLNIQRLK
jgi:hypothetical protein